MVVSLTLLLFSLFNVGVLLYSVINPYLGSGFSTVVQYHP